MSNIGSYKNTQFSENQKFLVLDPATGTTSLVLGSSLVEYIQPRLNSVIAETTRAAAENTDYDVGTLVQTSGATSPGDNFAATYLVVEGGSGDFPMLNGNDLLVIKGDEFLREQLIQNTAGDGSDLIAHTGTSDTVTEALDKRTIYVGSVAELEALTVDSGYVVELNAGGISGTFDVIAGDFSSELAADTENGVYIGLSDDPTATKKVAKRRQDDELTPDMFGAVPTFDESDGSGNVSTTAINAWAAFGADEANNVAILKLGAGGYASAQKVDLEGLSGVQQVSVKGNSLRYSKLIYTGAADIDFLSLGVPFTGLESTGFREVSGFLIENFPNNKAVATGIRWQSASAVSSVDNMRIKGFKIGARIRDNFGCSYRNLYIVDCGEGIYFERQPNATFIQNAYVQKCDKGITLEQPWAATVQSCVVERDTSTSLSVAGGNALIQGCYFEAAQTGHQYTITVSAQGGEPAPVVTVRDCLLNNNIGDFYVECTSARRLSVLNNTVSTPTEATKPLVGNRDTVNFAGPDSLEISGNVVRYTPTITTPTQKALITPLLGDGMIKDNNWKRTLVIGPNGQWTQRGTILSGCSNLLKVSDTDSYSDPSLADNGIDDAMSYYPGNRFWNPKGDIFTISTNQGDTGTLTTGVAQDGATTVELVADGGAWSTTTAYRPVDLSYLQGIFGTNATIAIHILCFCKDGRVRARRRTGSTVGQTASSPYTSGWGWAELVYKLKLNLDTTFEIGVSAFGGTTGYFAPVSAMIIGTGDWYDYDRLVSY